MASYLMHTIIAFDLFMNVVFGGRFGETISARVGLTHAWYDEAIAGFLNELQPHHTELAREHDLGRDLEAITDLEKKRGSRK